MDAITKLKDLQRFWNKVRVTEPNECWEWLASKDKAGYGWFCYKGRMHGAHRISFLFEHEHINKNLMVLHSCDNPGCVNPAHLRQGTTQDNMDDKVKRNRQSRPLGELNPSNKLSMNQVIAIRHDNRVQRIIADEYGITQATVSLIKSKKRWGYI